MLEGIGRSLAGHLRRRLPVTLPDLDIQQRTDDKGIPLLPGRGAYGLNDLPCLGKIAGTPADGTCQEQFVHLVRRIDGHRALQGLCGLVIVAEIPVDQTQLAQQQHITWVMLGHALEQVQRFVEMPIA